MFAEGRWNTIAFPSRVVESSSPSSTSIMGCDGIDQPVLEYRHSLSTAADIVSMCVVVKKNVFPSSYYEWMMMKPEYHIPIYPRDFVKYQTRPSEYAFERHR